MLRMKKVLKGIIRGLDHIVNFIALSLILAAMFLSGYMLWDSHQVYQTADANSTIFDILTSSIVLSNGLVAGIYSNAPIPLFPV